MRVHGRHAACESSGERESLEVAMTGLQQSQEQQKQQDEPMGCLPSFLRFTWMASGNAALFLCAALVAKGTAPVVMDIVFFAVTIGLIVVRYIDITRFKGQTSEGKPATLAHWRRYALRH
jgi:hypothetical protein